MRDETKLLSSGKSICAMCNCREGDPDWGDRTWYIKQDGWYGVCSRCSESWEMAEVRSRAIRSLISFHPGARRSLEKVESVKTKDGLPIGKAVVFGFLNLLGEGLLGGRLLDAIAEARRRVEGGKPGKDEGDHGGKGEKTSGSGRDNRLW